MSKIVDKLAGALGFSAAAEEEEFDEYEDDYEEAEELPVSSNRKVTSYDAFSRKAEANRFESSRSTATSSRSSYDTGFRPTGTRSMGGNRNNKVLNLHANVQMEVVVASPETFEEAREISQHI